MHLRSTVTIIAGALAAVALSQASAGPPPTVHPRAAVDSDRHHQRWVKVETWHPYQVLVSPLLDPQAPLDFNSPAAPAGEEYWYFCPGTGTYYPYIESCPGGWRLVPAAIGAVPPGG